MRDLTSSEQQLIRRIAAHLSKDESNRLISDLSNAHVNLTKGNNSRITFEITGYKRPPFEGQHPFGVEGRVLDSDDAVLSVVLHADQNGRLLELEIVRFDDGEVLAPNWETLQLW